jgi:very-short-patch-repair endonuclease
MNLAKGLRRNQTEAEVKVWSSLKAKNINGIKFRRQQPIGNYIVDFVSFEAKLIIEIDGGQHNETPAIEKDERRTKWLESQGFQVLRFWNNDVTENPDGVLKTIYEALENRPHPLLPLPRERTSPPSRGRRNYTKEDT